MIARLEHVVALVVLSFDPCCGAAVRPDTTRLAGRLERFRHYKTYELSAAEYRSIQREYLGWADSRMKAGIGLKEMNEELRAANLLSDGPESVDDMSGRSYAGFLAGVEVVPVSGANDLLAIKLGVHTGGYCNFDQTVVLYSRQRLRRIAQINAEPTHMATTFVRWHRKAIVRRGAD